MKIHWIRKSTGLVGADANSSYERKLQKVGAALLAALAMGAGVLCAAEVPDGYFTNVWNTGFGVNTSFQERHPILSPNGKEFYYTANDRIWVATRADTKDPFGPARDAQEIAQGIVLNSGAGDFCGSMSYDLKELYFGSWREGNNTTLYVARRAGPGEPFVSLERLGPKINMPGVNAGSPKISADGLWLFFIRNLTVDPATHTVGPTDIWAVRRQNKGLLFGLEEGPDPEKLWFCQSIHDEWRPSISADGRFLFFSDWFCPGTSFRPGGRGGADIWVTYRRNLDDLSDFVAPVNLNDLWPPSTVNSETSEAEVFISADWPAYGSKIYLISNRSGSWGGVDIWEATWAPRYPQPHLEIAPATLLSWPETPVTYRVEGAPDPAGPWTPCPAECSDVVVGRQRMYMAPEDQAECYRLTVLDPGVPLYYKDFTDLSGWFVDPGGTATVTNDDLLLHVNRMSATPFDNWPDWTADVYPNASFSMPTNGTLELRCDVVGANQDDAFASVTLWRFNPLPHNAYGLSKDQNEILIWKFQDAAAFHAEQVAIKNENITLSLALTPRGSNLEIHARVFDRDNHNALLWEKVVLDTPAVDPTIPNGSWKGFVTYPDLHPAPYTGANFVPFILCHYWNSQRAPNPPGAEVIFDSFTVWQYEVPALEVGPAAMLSWPETTNPCRIVETATSLPGPWTTLFTGANNLVDGHRRMFVPANEQARFFRLTEEATLRINSWPTAPGVLAGSNITLRVEATGLSPLSYEWRFNGEVIEGVLGNSLTITNAQASDEGQYVVTISDTCGSITTEPATLLVLGPPTIVEHPQSQTVQVGGTVTFSVTVTNTAALPVGYRWRHGSANLTNQVLNERTASYTINNVQLTDAGQYTVVVTNAAFSTPGYLSNPATLTVEP